MVMAQDADLRVVGRGSSFQFRGAEKAAANVGALLGATHVLDGSVRRSGDRIRLTAQLVGCARETTLWSKRFDRELVDTLDLQEELAAAVAAELKVAFEPIMSSGPARLSAVDRIDPWRSTRPCRSECERA